MIYLDTQILTYAFQGLAPLPKDGMILSVAAKEFLQVYADSRTKDRYYFPASPPYYNQSGMGSTLDDVEVRPPNAPNPIGKRLSDKLIVDFGGEYPSLVEFSSHGIAAAVRSHSPTLFSVVSGHLDKDLRKTLRKRYDFICASGLPCEPLLGEDVRVGFELLDAFRANNNPKANFRNTWNDILILARGVRLRARVETRDKVLAKLAAEVWKADLRDVGELVRVDFAGEPIAARPRHPESKGFVNRGWKVLEQRQRNVRRG